MSRRGVPGFWRERARGVGYVVLLGAAVLVVAAIIATVALVAGP